MSCVSPISLDCPFLIVPSVFSNNIYITSTPLYLILIIDYCLPLICENILYVITHDTKRKITPSVAFENKSLDCKEISKNIVKYQLKHDILYKTNCMECIQYHSALDE